MSLGKTWTLLFPSAVGKFSKRGSLTLVSKLIQGKQKKSLNSDSEGVFRRLPITLAFHSFVICSPKNDILLLTSFTELLRPHTSCQMENRQLLVIPHMHTQGKIYTHTYIHNIANKIYCFDWNIIQLKRIWLAISYYQTLQHIWNCMNKYISDFAFLNVFWPDVEKILRKNQNNFWKTPPPTYQILTIYLNHKDEKILLQLRAKKQNKNKPWQHNSSKICSRHLIPYTDER